MLRNPDVMLAIIKVAEADTNPVEIGGEYEIDGITTTHQEYLYHLTILHEGGYIHEPHVKLTAAGTLQSFSLSLLPRLTNKGHNKIFSWRQEANRDPNNSRSSLPPTEW